MIRTCAILILTTVTIAAQTPVTLKSILLEQLRTTHNQKDWFVPVNVALDGLTADKPAGRMAAETTPSVSWRIICSSGTNSNSPS